MPDMSKTSLYGMPFTIILTDGTALDGQVVLLAEDQSTAKASATAWLSRTRPWTAGGSDTHREIQRTDIAEPEELQTFYCYGIGSRPSFWEMHRQDAQTSEERPSLPISRERATVS